MRRCWLETRIDVHGVAVISKPPFVEPRGSKEEEYFGLETKATSKDLNTFR